MGILGKLVLISITLTAVGIGYIVYKIKQVPELPKLESTWWGPGQPRKVDESIRNFKINVPEEVLQDLKRRLENHVPLTPPLETVNFEYGFNTDYLKKVIEFWKTKYNWREREAFLNSLPQFKTNVDGLDLHFIHVKPQNVDKNTRVLPLLLLHGWPGSIREFYGLIPLLTTPRKDVNFVFEVIAPSLPGYGFSEGASKPGLGVAETAVVMKDLMERIGFKKFYAQGGDLGALILHAMQTVFPESLYGVHSNFCVQTTYWSHLMRIIGSIFPSLVVDEDNVHSVYPLSKEISDLTLEMGYLYHQATKPDTVGVALRDSPVGLAAYILEKFSTATNRDWRYVPDGGLTRKFKLVDLLDNVMIYWVTGSMTTAIRIYKETMNVPQFSLLMENIPSQVPTGCTMFPNEFWHTPESLLKDKYPNLVRYANMARGGHFAALEEPELFAEDVWETFKIIETFRKTV